MQNTGRSRPVVVTILAAATGAVLLALPGHAAVFGPTEWGNLVFSADFQNGVNPFAETGGPNGGATTLLSDYTALGNYAVSFSDTATGNANASAFNWTLNAANAPTLINTINAALNKPAGSATDFIFDFKVERMSASSNPLLTQCMVYLDALYQHSGQNPADGVDRVTFGQVGMATTTTPSTPLADYDSDGVLELIDNSEYPLGNTFQTASGTKRGLRFRIVSDVLGGADQSGTDLATLLLYGYVRVNTGATEEKFAIDDIRIFEVVPEPASGLLLAAAGLTVLRRRK